MVKVQKDLSDPLEVRNGVGQADALACPLFNLALEKVPNGQSRGFPGVSEFEPSAAEDPPCREGRFSLDLSMLKRPAVGVAWKLGEEVLAQVSSLSLDMVQNYEVHCQ
ncbi:hypothetical protein TNCV_4189691 [Trichonephila clavipes]|nr:hypothetical protein TNCV_4189691 [Trichonephila clavipes]